MPLVQLKRIEGVFDPEQKREMIEKVTDAMGSMEGENMRLLTWVLVQEDVKSGDWGIGGQGGRSRRFERSPPAWRKRPLPARKRFTQSDRAPGQPCGRLGARR